ncbi:hypothetical protein Cgig2_011656 [Carnegiea gigantea]|uniref:Uncharacterized protein n=1 Tax=Carnegiea gigantea TaxID=171969 RepID=A0A9Q1JQ11_9CARY|nr:hypothetical protein Cgig2_011656 [Carnegiea gigantea]
MTFGLEDMRPLQTPHNDVLVIQLKILTTNGSANTYSIDVITLECLKNLQYNDKGLEAINAHVAGFEGQAMYHFGNIPMTYNVILGRPTLNAIKVVVAPHLLLIQFKLDDEKVGKLYEDQKMAMECYYVSLKSLGRKEEPPTGETSRPNKTGKKVATEAMEINKIAQTADNLQSMPKVRHINPENLGGYRG